MTDTTITEPRPTAAPDPGPPRASKSSPRRRLVLAAGAVVLATGIAAGGYALGSIQEHQSRQRIVADRGVGVMPFDQAKTSHTFTTTPSGGIETVVANNPGDTAQIELVRGHLRQVTAAFSAGDFSDPAATHGIDMPGLATLSAGASRLRIVYDDVPSGGHITYGSSDPALVVALHDWFAAQNNDHNMSH